MKKTSMRSNRKLRLSTKTLRVLTLSPSELARVAGGTDRTRDPACGSDGGGGGGGGGGGSTIIIYPTADCR